jgi:hypothetical protein
MGCPVEAHNIVAFSASNKRGDLMNCERFSLEGTAPPSPESKFSTAQRMHKNG